MLNKVQKSMKGLFSGVPPYIDGTPPNPSTIHVMVGSHGSPSKKQIRVRDMLQSFGNLSGIYF